MEIRVSLWFWFHFSPQGGCPVVRSAGEPRTGPDDPSPRPDEQTSRRRLDDGRIGGADDTTILVTDNECDDIRCRAQVSGVGANKTAARLTGRRRVRRVRRVLGYGCKVHIAIPPCFAARAVTAVKHCQGNDQTVNGFRMVNARRYLAPLHESS